jgi:hypothetical protein
MAAAILLLGMTTSLFAQETAAKAGNTRMVKLNIGTKGDRRVVKNTRGMAFGGAAVIVGTGRHERAHIYTATSCADLVPGSIEKIDAKKQAADLGAGVTMFIPNVGRYWTMDEIGVYVDEVNAHVAAPYAVGKILRNTEWIYKAGKPVYLLREPGGVVWVMQEYTKEVDPSLTIDNLQTVGSKLKNLPAGWEFETKVLTKDLSLDNRRTGLWSSIIRDELGNTYEAAGFDDLANYVP